MLHVVIFKETFIKSCLLLDHSGSTGGFLLLRYFSGGVSNPRDLRVSQYVISVKSSSLIHHRSFAGVCLFPMFIHGWVWKSL